ncbi:MAG: nitroreductase family protein [Candidatus Bathyarchaeota archaeon]|nr:nitroreductase family protein [Candidatus Bathyarchaeota archaeon]
MEFDKVIKTRRSIRKYKGTPVPRESLMKILEAARIAPSAAHRQPWHFVVVEDKETIEKLAGRSKWASEAPAMIVGLADPVASPNWCLNDMGIAFEHIVLTATSLGLGTCWMGQTKRDAEVKEILGIPGELNVIALTPLGEPDEVKEPKERKSLEEIVSWGRYGGKSG